MVHEAGRTIQGYFTSSSASDVGTALYIKFLQMVGVPPASIIVADHVQLSTRAEIRRVSPPLASSVRHETTGENRDFTNILLECRSNE